MNLHRLHQKECKNCEFMSKKLESLCFAFSYVQYVVQHTDDTFINPATTENMDDFCYRSESQ